MKIFNFQFSIFKNKKGFTLVELLVAMGLFVIFITIASGGFIRALRTQRNIVALIAANENTSLALEQMAREIRTGSNFSSPNETELDFTNAVGEDVVYRLKDTAVERNSQPLTATNVKINKLIFKLGNNHPARITIILNNFQTTVSSRNLDT